MEQDLDPSFVVLSEAEEELLKQHVQNSESDSDDASDEDESFFTLEELITEFNETKDALMGMAARVGVGGSDDQALPPLSVLYDVKTAVATHYGTLEDVQYELDSLSLATAEDREQRKAVTKELEAQFNNISIIDERCDELIKKCAEERKNDGNALFKSGKFEESVASYSAAISINPNNPLFYTNRALAYSRIMKYDEAIADARKARILDVNFLKSYVIQAKCQLATGLVEDACDTLDSAPIAYQSQNDVVELRQQVSVAAKEAGNACFKKKDMDGAIRLYSVAITCSPENHLLYSNRSAAYQAKGQWLDALHDAERCTHINEYFPKGYLHMGHAELQLKRWDDAISTVDMAQSVLSDLDGFEAVDEQLQEIMRLAVAGKQGYARSGPARPAAANATTDNRTRAEQFKLRGNEYYKSEEYQEAVRYYSQAIALCQDEGTYYGNRAAAWVMLKEFKRGVADCVEGLQHEKAPGQLDKLRQRQAAALASTGEHDAALAVLQDALLLDGRSEEDQEACVRTFGQLIDKLKAAVDMLEQGKESIAKGEYSRSKRLFENAANAGLSDDPAVLVGLSQACLGLEDYEEASRQAQKVIAASGNNVGALSDAYVVRAAALQATGCTDLAAKHLTAALQRDPDNAGIINKLKALRNTVSETQRVRAAVDAAMNARNFEDAIKICGDGINIDRNIKKLVSEFYARRAKAYSMLAKQQRRMESALPSDAGADEVPNYTASWKKCLQDAHTAIYYDGDSSDTVQAMFLKTEALQALERFQEALDELEHFYKAQGPGHEERSVKEKYNEAKLLLKKSKRVDLYKLLGCTRGDLSSEKEIKTCYRKAALKWHPDRHSASDQATKDLAEKTFKEIGDAYDLLCDPQRKALYDQGYDREEIEQRVEMAKQQQQYGGRGGHPHSHHYGYY